MKKVIIAENILKAVGKNNTLFGRGGITVLPAKTAEEALELHRQFQADIIIIDYAIPAMGGVKLSSTIRSDVILRDVSIIILCDPPGPTAAESQNAGANAILLTPLDCSELFSKVSHLLMVQDRMSVRVPLRISVDGEDEKAAFVGMSLNISVSGMLLESGRVLQRGDRLQCAFTLQSRAVKVDCIVVRAFQTLAGSIKYGVKFLNLDAKTFVLLEHLIKSKTGA